jgi:hypothetical protein
MWVKNVVADFIGSVFKSTNALCDIPQIENVQWNTAMFVTPKLLNVELYGVPQEKSSVLQEITVSVILSKRVYIYI